MNNNFTVIDLFAGAGGLSKAFLEAGAEIVWANELDKNACDLYRENFNDVFLVEGDIQNIKSEDIPEFDLLVSGFPCQAFSMKGIDKGIANLGRNLFYEIIRIIKAKKPRGFLLENVKGLRNHDNGRTFKIMTEELKNEGYYIKSTILNAKDYGNVPHNKERMYIVGFREKKEFEIFDFPHQIPLLNKVSDHINIHEPQNRIYYCGKNVEILKDTKGVDTTVGVIYQLRYKNIIKDNIISESYICPALTTYINNNIYIPMIKDDYGIRKLTPNECFSFQGFHDIKIPSRNNVNIWYKYATNCSSVTVTERIAKNIFYALDHRVQDMKEVKLIEKSVKINSILVPQTTFGFKRDNDLKNINNSAKLVYEQTREITFEKEKKNNIIDQEKAINNEKEFTINKVIPALKNKGCFDVRYNHGNDEYGKDITYKYKDNFDIIKCGAVQVKFGNISGGTQGDIDIILSQIDDAFNIPFMDIKENKEQYIKQLLIICSGKYTKNATEKIKNKFKKGYDVYFLDGQDIDNLID